MAFAVMQRIADLTGARAGGAGCRGPAVLVLLACLLPGSATGQSATGTPAAPEAADDASAGIGRVGNCYVANSTADGGGGIVVEVRIDKDGKVAGLPVLIDPPTAGSPERLLFVEAVFALEICAPYGPAAAGLHRLAVSREAIRLIGSRPLPPPLSEPPSAQLPAAPPAPPAALAAPDRAGGAPEPPVAQWIPASAASQDALGLARGDVAEIQARLTAMDFDPGGIDGLAGKATRAALTDWQQSAGIPATGYLDRRQLAALKTQSETDFAAWKQSGPNRAALQGAAAAKRRLRPEPPPGYFWYNDRLSRRILGNLIYSCK